jgi:mono/diheme cytochrome c family protein
LADSPDGSASTIAVTTVTPVGKRAIADRSPAEEIGCGSWSLAAMRFGGKYDAAGVRPVPVLFVAALAALALSACGSEGIQISEDDPMYEGAVLFSERCSGCHTFSVAGTQGSGNQILRQQGPDFDARQVSVEDALFAIRNGGFGGAIMPQNIVVGDDADLVAEFLAEHSGGEVEETAVPSPIEERQPVEEEAGQEGPGN